MKPARNRTDDEIALWAAELAQIVAIFPTMPIERLESIIRDQVQTMINATTPDDPRCVDAPKALEIALALIRQQRAA